MDYDVDAINESQMVEKSYSKARQKEIEMKLWLLRSSLGHTLVLAMLASYLLKILLHSEFLEIKRLEQKIYLLPEVAKRKKEGLEKRCSSSLDEGRFFDCVVFEVDLIFSFFLKSLQFLDYVHNV
jgi:hypothetical protein